MKLQDEVALLGLERLQSSNRPGRVRGSQLQLESASFESVLTSSLREQVRRIIRGRIIAGDIVPGAIYSIPQFAALLGVSATPVREAVLDLGNQDLVEVVRNRGFRVPDLTERDIDEVIQLRLMLEVPAVIAIAKDPPTHQLADLRRMTGAITASAQAGDLVGFVENDRDFHLALLSCFGNQRLVAVVGRLRDQSRLYRGLADTGPLMDFTREHDELLDAVERADAGAAEKVITRHVKHARDIWAGRQEDGKI
jgi:DNA-binding GntR family transcriptional regulator